MISRLYIFIKLKLDLLQRKIIDNIPKEYCFESFYQQRIIL